MHGASYRFVIMKKQFIVVLALIGTFSAAANAELICDGYEVRPENNGRVLQMTAQEGQSVATFERTSSDGILVYRFDGHDGSTAVILMSETVLASGHGTFAMIYPGEQPQIAQCSLEGN
jgi:hypothetical protein